MDVSEHDPLGRLLLDYHEDDLAGTPIHRRDDDHTSRAPAEWYFTPAAEWPEFECAGIGRARGGVLDVGCGAGRAGLFLQRRGHDVLGVDVSPGAVRVAADRGVERTALAGMDHLPVTADEFLTVLFAGKQFALGESLDDLEARLRRLYTVVPPGGRIVADLDDPGRVIDPEHGTYQAANRLRDGVTRRRFRLEYADLTGPWLELLSVSPTVLRDVAGDTGWLLADLFFDGDGPRYWVVLERVDRDRA